MHLAIQSDFDNIKSIFYQHKAWFPHVRTDYMRQMIDLQRCIYSHGVVLTFHTAKRKQTIGTVKVNKGDTVLHQIANSTPGNGNGTKILLQFFDWCKQDVYLSVKTDNHKARK